MTEERLKEIKDSIDFQEKIANAYNCSDVVIVLNEERELYNEVVRLREIIDKANDEIEYFELQAKHLDDSIYLDETLTNKLKEILKQYNLTLEQLTGVENE